MNYVLSEDDAKVLRLMVDDYRQRVINTRARPAIDLEAGLPQAPEVYVAHAHSGIPAMSSPGGTGTGVGALALDVPGSATCAVFRRLTTGLIPVGLNLTVHNYSTAAVASDSWVVVTRDKFGDWLAIASTGGGGGSPTPLPVSTFSGALVCNSADQPIGSTATVLTFDTPAYDTDSYWDALGNQFVIPLGFSGYYALGANLQTDASTAPVYAYISAGGLTSAVADSYESASVNGHLGLYWEGQLVDGDVVSVSVLSPLTIPTTNVQSVDGGLPSAPIFWIRRLG